jgi:hypothetical protein
MKNFLATLLLLTSTFALSQAAYLNMTTSDVSNIAVGDTLQVTVKNTNMQSTPSLAQFDIEFNNQLLNHVGTTYPVTSNGTNSSAQTALSTFTGYKWSDGTNLSGTVISQQYDNWGTNSSGYSTSTDWTVLRTTIQDGQTLDTDTSLVTFSFVIKDRASTNYTNYSSIVELNWGRLVNNSSNTSYDTHTQAGTISLTNVAGVNAGTVTINVLSPHSNKDKMKYEIYDFTQVEAVDWDGDGTNGSYWPKTGETPIYSGNFDANGQFQTTNLAIDGQYLLNLISEDGGSGWMDEIVTVTDAYKVFQYLSGTDINNTANAVFEYKIQEVMAEVTEDEALTFDDSYEILAHINGYTTSNNVTSAAGTGAYHLNSLIADWGVPAEEMLTRVFTVTETVKTFNFAHSFRGDLDFSHSTEPTAAAAKNNPFTVSSMVNLTSKNNDMIVSFAPDENYNLDVNSAIVNGKVELTVNLTREDLVGAQINLKYDTTKLTFDSIVYDTGNEMTNFSRVKEDKIWIGSLDTNGAKFVKSGTPYKVIFNMNQQLANTAGLISYSVTEGVKANGTKVKFNIQ